MFYKTLNTKLENGTSFEDQLGIFLNFKDLITSLETLMGKNLSTKIDM